MAEICAQVVEESYELVLILIRTRLLLSITLSLVPQEGSQSSTVGKSCPSSSNHGIIEHGALLPVCNAGATGRTRDEANLCTDLLGLGLVLSSSQQRRCKHQAWSDTAGCFCSEAESLLPASQMAMRNCVQTRVTNARMSSMHVSYQNQRPHVAVHEPRPIRGFCSI